MNPQEAMDGSPSRVQKTLFLADGMQRMVIDITFQVGPIREVGVNGCAIEDVIDVLVARLEGFQKGPFRCRENALAITKLEEAKHWLNERTRKRQEQGVEGRNVAHQD